MDIETVIGLILIILAAIGYLFFLIGRKWLEARDDVHLLKLALDSAEAKAKQSAEALWEMQKWCRDRLIAELCELGYQLNRYSPTIGLQGWPTLAYYLGTTIPLWDIVEPHGSARTWAYELTRKILHANKVTTGHLATWRTEIAAAQVYLLQLDGNGQMGWSGRRRDFEDDEIREIAPLKGGMRWIIDRKVTMGHCPFDFGPNIVEDLDELITRIEALAPASA